LHPVIIYYINLKRHEKVDITIATTIAMFGVAVSIQFAKMCLEGMFKILDRTAKAKRVRS
jgi:hypothetical protein